MENGVWCRVARRYFLDAKQEVGWHEREDALSRFSVRASKNPKTHLNTGILSLVNV